MVLEFHTKLFYLICTFVGLSQSGPNNLHLSDGTSTAELISGDVFFEVVSPVDLEYTYRLRPAKDFGIPYNDSFQLKNIPLVPVVPKYGCVVPTNQEEIEGNVAFVERGECSFKTKTLIAERCGARAVIITDTTVANEDYYIEMIDDDTEEDVHIPAGFLMGKNGNMIRRTLAKLNMRYALINIPVNLTFTPVHKINQPPWLGW